MTWQQQRAGSLRFQLQGLQIKTWLPAEVYWRPSRCSSNFQSPATDHPYPKTTKHYWAFHENRDRPIHMLTLLSCSTHRTWVWPAISIPASRNSSKLSLNFPEASASWVVVPREAWTTSPADWFRSAAVWFRSLWASWKLLLHGGSWNTRTHTQHVDTKDTIHVEQQLFI